MMQFTKKALLVLMSLILVVSMVACRANKPSNDTDVGSDTSGAYESELGSESESESETTSTVPSTTTIETPGYATLFSESGAGSVQKITGAASVGLRISIDEGCFLNSVTGDCVTEGDRIGAMELNFYRWNTDFKTTVAAEPVFSYTIENFVSQQWDTSLMGGQEHVWFTVDLPEGEIGEGEWLYLYENGTGNAGVSLAGNSFIPADEGGVVSVQSVFLNGRANDRTVPKTHVTYTRTETTTDLPKPDDGSGTYTQLTPGKAHVIILSGQSNAAGASAYQLLSAEEKMRLQNGFENVQVYSDCWEPALTPSNHRTSDGFQKCTYGMSSYATTMGPELGMAAYLAEAYPDETFYVIKAAMSGTSLADHWGSDGVAYTFFDAHVETALAELESMGLEPEIFAFMWLQGESDAQASLSTHVNPYIDNFQKIINRVETKYGDYIAEGGMAIVDAEIRENTVWNYASIVNQQKRIYAAQSLNRYCLDTNAANIDTWDEAGDPMHYDSDDMIELGEMYGAAIAQILVNAGYPAPTN